MSNSKSSESSSRTSRTRAPAHRHSKRKDVHSLDAAIDHSLDAVSDDFSMLTFECIVIHGVTTTETNGNIIAQTQFVTDEQRSVANLKGKVDTGAQGNILPVRLYR